VANGINTVHLAYVREQAGHALIGAREWIPAGHISDTARSAAMGLPEDLVFRTKGQLAIDILTDSPADGVKLDFVCGDEVYGAGGITLTCKQAAARLGSRRGWEIRSAGTGSKGHRWYAWAWLATASPRHHLLIRRHLQTGELAFHYCYLPEGQPASSSRPVRAAGLRWPAEEDFEFGKDCFGLDQSQVRLYTAIARHTVLVMAALAICAVTAALLRRRTGSQAPAPALPDQPRPADPGMIPLTIPETGRLLAHPPPPGSAGHWLDWRRRHQACSRRARPASGRAEATAHGRPGLRSQFHRCRAGAETLLGDEPAGGQPTATAYASLGHAGVMGSCSSVTHLSGSSGHSRVSSRTCPELR
jgi:hypothetical protein